MRFNSVKSGNFTSAARAVNRSADQMFQASRESAPDFTGISKAAIAARTKERNAATTAKNLLDVTEIKADALVEGTQLKVDSDKAVADAKRPAKRMAGVVAGLGTLATTGAMMVQDKRDKAEDAKHRAASDARWARQQEERLELLKSGRSNDTDTIEPFKPTPFPEFKPSGGTTDTTKSGGTSTYTPPKPDKIYSKSEMQTLAVQGGFDPKDAPLVARIAMGESSGNPTAFNGVGRDQSYGLMQINMLGEMGPERRSQFGITSNEELNDPLTNMKAAHAIYKQQGWGAWGAYTNGSYAKF